MSDWTDFLPFFPLRSQVGRVWAQSDFGPLVTEGVYNWNPAYLRRTAKALADVRSGKARAVINYLGDSGVMGAGAGDGGSGYTNAWARSAAYYLAKAINAADPSIPIRRSEWFGTKNLTTASGIMAYDPRLTFSGGAAPDNVRKIVNANFIKHTGAGQTNFTPTEQFDRIRVWYGTDTTLGTFTVAVDGGATLATQSTAAATNIGYVDVSCTLGAHTVNIANAIGTIFLIGVECWASGTTDLMVRNLGWTGSRSTDWTTTTYPYSPLSALDDLGGALTIIKLYRNDQNTGVTPATFKANMQAILDVVTAYSDVILIRGHEPYSWTLTNDAGFLQALKELSDQYSALLFNMVQRQGTGAVALANGLFCTDNIHYTQVGWAQDGFWLGRMIASL